MIRALAISLALLACPAAACVISEPPTGWVDEPVRIASDCSFERAEKEHFNYLSGRTPLDLKNGRVGQRWEHGTLGCASGESLVVADCFELEIVRIFGQPDPVNPVMMGGGYVQNSVDFLYPPSGKVRLTPTTTVGDLIVLAEAEGYEYRTNVVGFAKGLKPINRFDPFCGCKLFYDGSPGSMQ